MTTKDTDMNVQFDKTRVSVFSILGIASGLVVTAFGWGVVYTQLNNKIEENSAQAVRVENHLTAIDVRLQPFDTAMFRLTSVEAMVKANNESLNDRMDRIVGSLGSKIDTLTETMNGVRTDLKVLSQKVDANTSEKRASILDNTPPAFRVK